MAANKFATMLHRNTNKITLILTYAVLEWILIVLLLLNSLFSYLIIKYAKYFGLKPPCPWCTRIDHLFDPSAKGSENSIPRDLLCEAHSKEISKLGYCSNHGKLVESESMCEDCVCSSKGSPKSLALFPWMKGFGKIRDCGEGVCESAEVVSLNCSCCGVSLNYNYNSVDAVSNVYSSYELVKTSSSDVLDSREVENFVTEARDYGNDVGKVEDENETEEIAEIGARCVQVSGKGIEENVPCVSADNEMKEFQRGEEEKMEVVQEMETLVMKDKSIQVFVVEEEEEDGEVSPKHLEYFLDYNGHGLVPFELIDPITEEHKMTEDSQILDENKLENRELGLGSEEKEELVKNEKGSMEVGNLNLIDIDITEQAKVAVVNSMELEEELVKNERGSVEVGNLIDIDINEQAKVAVLDSMELEEDENSLVFHAKDSHLVEEKFEQFPVFPLAHFPNGQELDEAAGGEKHSDTDEACQDVSQIENNENEADVSIGTEIPDLDAADEIEDEIENQEYVHAYEYTNTNEDHLTSSTNVYQADDHDSIEKQMEQLKPLIVQHEEPPVDNQHSLQLELNETEEDKVPDTPTSSSDSFMQLHKKLLLLEKRDSGAEESLDSGSVTSELEGGEAVVTVEHLKSALRAERKALQVLYSELEEERSASAVAASQTMAMINRLQEEKAAMQMEALQYQRMMEEQSEYDQEALQLLNELMVKREKEKQDLEKELEAYRKKLFDYESREKMRRLRRSKDSGSTRGGFSSTSCSNAEDSDGLSIDLNQDTKEEDGFYSHDEYSNHNTPVDAVFKLEESLADFEEERISILEQLKGLEEKLMTMDDDDEEQHFVDGIHVAENGDHVDGNGHLNGESNGHANGFSSEVNGKHDNKRKSVGQKGKSLLPLFDATIDENEDTTISNGNGNGIDANGVHDLHDLNSDMESKKFLTEEEVDHLYERLQALEADREFLKHCISSVKKGDKGVDLLQEILQHLRDLRNVELRVRNLTDSPVM